MLKYLIVCAAISVVVGMAITYGSIMLESVVKRIHERWMVAKINRICDEVVIECKRWEEI